MSGVQGAGGFVLVWFRRDLRFHDHRVLEAAIKTGLPIYPLFIFDTEILDPLEKKDPRVEFIHDRVQKLHREFMERGGALRVEIGRPVEVFNRLFDELGPARKKMGHNGVDGSSGLPVAVFCGEDFESYARQRDGEVKGVLEGRGVKFVPVLDQAIFHPEEVLKPDGKPYHVFTPFSRSWKKKYASEALEDPPGRGFSRIVSSMVFHSVPGKTKKEQVPSLRRLGFQKTGFAFPDSRINLKVIQNYHQTRDDPWMDLDGNGVSHLGIHLRFGTISIRELVRLAWKENETFLNQLIWREFFMMILYHYPHVETGAFRRGYDRIHWKNPDEQIERWKTGETGFPIVDAGMRELAATGNMHNRVRMISASFFAKNMLADWRIGERYFASKLLDYELASNNGGWQWAAGTGCDAAPYFRIFNPIAQQKRFDPDFLYIKKWVPEFGGHRYPEPMLDLQYTRQRALNEYRSALNFIKKS